MLDNIKLGRDDDQPEFTNFQWFAMLFGGGMGIGLVFWSVAEPMMHYMSPPFGTGGTVEAMHTAMRIVFFHCGIHAWVIFAIGGLALAYFQFRKGMPFLISSAFYPLIGDRIYGPIGKAIDILSVFATVFGVLPVLASKVWLSIAFMVFIFLFCAMVFILNTFTDSIGAYFQNFIGQSLCIYRALREDNPII